MPRPTPGVTNREASRLLTRWGCDMIRTRGGHAVWRTSDGVTLVFPCAGRNTHPTFASVKQAAEALGVTVDQFLAGPRKDHP